MKKKLSPLLSGLIGIGLSGVACWVTLSMQQEALAYTMDHMIQSPVLFVLNWLPMGLLTALLLCLAGNVFFSSAASNLVWGLLGYINMVKVMARGDPFVPGDVVLLFEGMEAAGSYELTFPLAELALVLGVSAAMALPGIWLSSRMPKIRWRAAGALLSVALFAGAVLGPYADKQLYETMPGPYRANVPRVFEAFGFPYTFLHNFNLYPIDRPDGYVQAQAEGYEDQFLQERKMPQTKPNILMIMCEAFTDLPNHEAFTYSREDNPIAYFNSLTARDDTVSGQMIVSNIGAGTANTEFDVLTGMMTNRIADGVSSAFRVVLRNTDSVPRALGDVGYQTFFTHPGQKWFYNRQSVYSYLGITDYMFNDVYAPEDFKGTWITDEAFLEKLTAALEARDGEAPIFAYGVTIQNHQAYTEEKYGYLPKPVQTDIALTDEAQEFLSVYFEGLRDSDRMLENLTAWLQAQDEPWLLVFFGDHQPNLGADYLSFREIGAYPENLDTAENRLSQYTVPYVIWGNTAFHADSGMPQPEQTTISSHYLGAMTCQIAGFEGLDGYLDYLNQLRREIPVCSTSGYMTADGTYLEQLPEDLAAMEQLRWHWQYYRLKHQTID